MILQHALDFMSGRQHRFVRDYLLMTFGILVVATGIGASLSRLEFGADPMPVASTQRSAADGPRTYVVVRSVLDADGRSRTIALDDGGAAIADPLATGAVPTGNLAEGMRAVTIDPCTGAATPKR
jgi:hypothetical protein